MAACVWSVRSVRVLSEIIHGHVLPAAAAVRHQAGSSRSLHGARAPAVSARHLKQLGVTSLRSLSQVSLSEEPDALYQKLSVRVKGHDRSVLDSFEFFASLAARELGLSLERAFEPRKHTEKLTLLKSVHIFKKHRVQYETRTHHRTIEISRVTGSSARVYLEYIQRNLPEGVAMEVTKVTAASAGQTQSCFSITHSACLLYRPLLKRSRNTSRNRCGTRANWSRAVSEQHTVSAAGLCPLTADSHPNCDRQSVCVYMETVKQMHLFSFLYIIK
uniref:Small ribosomal subunit protein uS10m n=1 Tax=Cyprinus carpio TaxID=7962 RepID=A0A8C2BDM1_CYPCA